MDVDQAIAFGILLLIILSAVGIAFALLRLAKGAAAPISAEARRPASPKTASAAPLAYDPEITAAALLAIRSNLDGVSRQVEDLEKRLRLSAVASARAGLQQRRKPVAAGNDKAPPGALAGLTSI